MFYKFNKCWGKGRGVAGTFRFKPIRNLLADLNISRLSMIPSFPTSHRTWSGYSTKADPGPAHRARAPLFENIFVNFDCISGIYIYFNCSKHAM